MEYLIKAKNGRYVWKNSANVGEPYFFNTYQDALSVQEKVGGEIISAKDAGYDLTEGKVTTASGTYEYEELRAIEEKMKQAFKDYWHGKITHDVLEATKKELGLSGGEIKACQYDASREEDVMKEGKSKKVEFKAVDVPIEQFDKEFETEYGFLYDNRDNVAGYTEALDEFDYLIKNNENFKAFVKEFVKYHGDYISSDREAVAFMFALEKYIVDENTEIKTESIQSSSDILAKINKVKDDIKANDGKLDYNFYEKTSEIEEDIARLDGIEKETVESELNELNNLYSHYDKTEESKEVKTEEVRSDTKEAIDLAINEIDNGFSDDPDWSAERYPTYDKLVQGVLDLIGANIKYGSGVEKEPTSAIKFSGKQAIIDEIKKQLADWGYTEGTYNKKEESKKEEAKTGGKMSNRRMTDLIYEMFYWLDEVLDRDDIAGALNAIGVTEAQFEGDKDIPNDKLLDVLNNTITYVSEHVSPSDEKDTFKNSIGFTDDEMKELGMIFDDDLDESKEVKTESMIDTTPETFTAHCDECLEDFEYTFDPLNEVSNDIEIYQKGKDYAYYAECPNCGNLVEVGPEELDLVVTNVDDISKDGFFMEIMDKHTARKTWLDVSVGNQGWQYEFNQTKFDFDNDKDIVISMFIQELEDYDDVIWKLIDEVIADEHIEDLEECATQAGAVNGGRVSLYGEKAKQLREKKANKVSQMSDIDIVIGLEEDELTLQDKEDWERVKTLAKGLAGSQGFYGRLLANMEAMEDDIDDESFPIIL